MEKSFITIVIFIVVCSYVTYIGLVINRNTAKGTFKNILGKILMYVGMVFLVWEIQDHLIKFITE